MSVVNVAGKIYRSGPEIDRTHQVAEIFGNIRSEIANFGRSIFMFHL
ncbi:MAG: hypothetical protein MUE44_28135 [Oscillatoriaceae cyanobacterium Prado104]|nr:hypothetical protein [Oscillatoriaceae cyanobacterium Prado104]